MSQELIKVNINIASRAYPVLVSPKEKLEVPALEKRINTNVQQLQKLYPTMDIQDCLSMAIIKLAFDKDKGVDPALLEKATQIRESLMAVEQ